MMEKRKITARQVLNDVRAGLDDATLMQKYSLSAQGLQSVLTKMLRAGMVEQEELDARVPAHERTIELGLGVCPACGSPQGKDFTRCARCGFELPEYLRKPKAPDIRDQPTTAVVGKAGPSQHPQAARGPVAPGPAQSYQPLEAAETPASNLLRIIGQCRLLGIATLVAYALLVAALFAIVQLSAPEGLLNLRQAILAILVLGTPVIVIAVVIFLSLQALAEAIKVLLGISSPHGMHKG